MTDHPPYTGDNARCAKCGYDGVGTTYTAHGRCEDGYLVMDHQDTGGERLCRTCRRCDYHWDEAVVPAPEGDAHDTALRAPA